MFVIYADDKLFFWYCLPMKNREGALFPIRIECSHFLNQSSGYKTLIEHDVNSDHISADPNMFCEDAEPGLPELLVS